MENNKYMEGERVCKELFEKTGDPRFHNMMKGFKDLDREKSMEQQGFEREM